VRLFFHSVKSNEREPRKRGRPRKNTEMATVENVEERTKPGDISELPVTSVMR
jgi:hypothetical protein